MKKVFWYSKFTVYFSGLAVLSLSSVMNVGQVEAQVQVSARTKLSQTKASKAKELGESQEAKEEKKQAEVARQELIQKLKSLKRDISKTESAKEKASDALENSEEAISQVNRTLYELRQQQLRAEAKLNYLLEEERKLQTQVDNQKRQLSELLKQQYIHDDHDKVKLILSGDNPNRIQRDLQYMGYVSQTQAAMIDSLRVTLAEVERNKIEALAIKDELDTLLSEEKKNRKVLEKEKIERQEVLKDISQRLYAQKKEKEQIEKDEQRLTQLVSRLGAIIAEQERAEKARLAKLAKEKLEREKAEKLAKAKALKEQQEKIAALKRQGKEIPPELSHPKTETKAEPKDESPPPSYIGTDGLNFKQHKGLLNLPVRGEVLASFGSKRGDAPKWKGMFIKAHEGDPVKAVGAGRVVTAEWLRGYGNLIIIDHGQNYISIYSNNHALLKRVGDMVKAGEVIAQVGNTGGNETAGLYFEMRYKGQVFDPMTWMK